MLAYTIERFLVIAGADLLDTPCIARMAVDHMATAVQTLVDRRSDVTTSDKQCKDVFLLSTHSKPLEVATIAFLSAMLVLLPIRIAVVTSNKELLCANTIRQMRSLLSHYHAMTDSQSRYDLLLPGNMLAVHTGTSNATITFANSYEAATRGFGADLTLVMEISDSEHTTDTVDIIVATISTNKCFIATGAPSSWLARLAKTDDGGPVPTTRLSYNVVTLALGG
jgi:hypothetical protein